MKISNYILTFVTICSIALFMGCGSKEGHPLVTITSSVTPTYNGSSTSNVDVVQSLCTAGTLSGQYEYFADHGAIATFLVSQVSPSTFSQVVVTIDKYTIAYQSQSDSLTAPPIETASVNDSFSFSVVGSDTLTVQRSVSLVDLVRKVKYLNDVSGGAYGSSAGYLNNYTATYTFEGHDDHGIKFATSASVGFEAGSFDNCQ